MNVEVIIPFVGDCPYRRRALEHVVGLYPWPVTIAHGSLPWSKGGAVMPAILNSSADVVVVADADCWTDGICSAINAVEQGASWAIPHMAVHRLDAYSTGVVMAGGSPSDANLEEPPYTGIEGGGIVVLPLPVAKAVPLDPRYTGWGQEDESWAMALRKLTGPPWRGDAPLWHLWHPPQVRATRRRGSPEGWQLRLRYWQALHADTPIAMQCLIAEAHDAYSTPDANVHDHHARGLSNSR